MTNADQYFQQTTVATLPAPWAMAFLPDGRMLVTERPPTGASLANLGSEGNVAQVSQSGNIRIVTQSGAVSVPITGMPGNIGVLDVELSPDFAQNRVVYFSFMERDPLAPQIGRAAGEAGIDPAGIAVARAVLNLDNPSAPTFTDTSVIWRQLPKIISYPGSGEPGGRLTFSPDGDYLYVTAGDRQEFGQVQTLDNTLGKIIRLYPDGTVPTDNPFAGVAGALPEIWTLGHRNAYGLAFGTDGLLWENEMGPRGGDELNLIRAGANYGWPFVSYGNHYDGGLIPKPAPGDGYAASAAYWTPSIAPSGMISYTGGAFPDWQKDFIISGLQAKGLVIVAVNGTTASEIARIDLGFRTRDVVQGPDGSLWVLFDQPDGRLVKLSPLSSAITGTSISASTAISPLPQGDNTITALSNGNFLSVGVEELSDGRSSLKGQIYSPSGQAVGTLITLTQTTPGDQGQASFTATASGGFQVAYGSRNGSKFDIYLQAFNADGTPSGASTVANLGLAKFHSPPAIAATSNGNFAVAWLGSDVSDITDVRVRLFAANGTAISGEILVSASSGTGKIGGRIVALTDGGFAVSWTDYGLEADAFGNRNTAVRAQIFDAAGGKVGSPLTVNSSSAGNQDLSSLAALPTGGFVAAWRDDGYAYAGSTGTQGIWAQHISANGAKVGAPVQVTEAGSYGFAPNVTILPGIGFAIAWQGSPSTATSSRAIISRLFDFNGQPLGPEFVVATDAIRGFPSVAATSSDSSLIFGWTGAGSQASNDKVVSYKIIMGSAGDDSLGGTVRNDLIFGGTGRDFITGGAGADILSGGAGADTFRDTAAGLNGDTITDLSNDDKILVSDATIAGFRFSLDGHTLTYTGGSLTLTSLPPGRLFATENSSGGVNLAIGILPVVKNDFNGDGKSDILWRNESGQFSNSFAQNNGSFVANSAAANFASTDWKVVGTGDFNGDGRSDILWRSNSGQFGTWLANANGGLTYNATAGLVSVTNDWKIVGVGDFNGDGRSDILWRSDSGQFGTWLASPNGSFAYNAAAGLTTVDLNWQIAGIGDYNGDSRDDILWRNSGGDFGTWLANTNGSFTYNGAAVGIASLDISWKIQPQGHLLA